MKNNKSPSHECLVRALRLAKKVARLQEPSKPHELAAYAKYLVKEAEDFIAEQEDSTEARNALLPACYDRVDKVLSVRSKGRNFGWPPNATYSFYLTEPKAGTIILVMPGGLQVFSEDYSVAPGEGIQFVRMSDRVVLRIPEYIENEKECYSVVAGLGLTIGHIVDPHTKPPINWNQAKKYNEWEKAMRREVRLYDYDSFAGLDRGLSALCRLWLTQADWASTNHQEVVKALARDYQHTPAWKWIEDWVSKSVNASGANFDYLAASAPLESTKKPTHFIGAPVAQTRALLILLGVWTEHDANNEMEAGGGGITKIEAIRIRQQILCGETFDLEDEADVGTEEEPAD